MKKVLLLLVAGMLSGVMLADITVTGVVTQAEDGETVIGASIQEKGTTNGTITDIDGAYVITVKDKATLVVSYVGMKTQEVKVTGPKHDVVMQSEAELIEEVVVTAMGIKQEKKRLNFAVQNVGADDLTEGQSANLLNSLQGKVAGVNVTTGGGSPNSGSQLILRGITSISSSQSNEPLVVIDGMPMVGGVGDINPNDIESVTVLKGVAASALYGSEGSNGVLMITTKSAKQGKVQATVNATWQFDTPANLQKVQGLFMPGAGGFYKEQTLNGWGPTVGSLDTYNNVRNYFKDYGFYHKYDISMTGGTEKFQAMGSVSYSKADGIVVNDYKRKITALLKGSYSPNKYVTFSLMGNVIWNQYRSAGSISSIYSWPITDDITNYKTESGEIRYLYFADEKANSPISPLYSRYCDWGVNKNTRTLVQGSLEIHPVKGLNISARVGMDQNNYFYDGYSVPRFSNITIVDEPNITDPYLTQEQLEKINQSLLGSYSYSQSERRLLTATFMATYRLDLPKGFGMDFMIGSEIKQNESVSSSISGDQFIIPGIYSIQNVNRDRSTQTFNATQSHRLSRIVSGVFGEVRADYKGLASLSVTSRWDWSSTLEWSKLPYVYPSVTAGLTFSEIIPGWNETKNNWFSYGKLRGNFAQVGKCPQPYLFDRHFIQFQTLPDGGYSANPAQSVGFKLVPEMNTSWEIGADLKFLNNRLRLDVAYYNQIVKNQIVTVRVSHTTGHVLQTRNEGSVENQGMEITLEGDIIKLNGWLWTAGLNMSFNRGRVTGLPEGMTEIQGTQYGDIFPTAYLHGSTTSISGKDYLRNENGDIICDANGFPQINPNKSVLIGNREPKLLMGLYTSVKWNGLALSMQFDGRIGGDVVNVTGRGLWSNGMHMMTENYRGRQVVWKGVVAAGTDANGKTIYEQNTKPIVMDANTIINNYYSVSSNFLEDGSYMRLQYVTLSYEFAKLLKNVKGIENIKLSFTGSNLFLITRYTGSDPQINANTSGAGTGSAGIDNYAIPRTRGYALSLQVNF